MIDCNPGCNELIIVLEKKNDREKMVGELEPFVVSLINGSSRYRDLKIAGREWRERIGHRSKAVSGTTILTVGMKR